jgi:hypothetical protein
MNPRPRLGRAGQGVGTATSRTSDTGAGHGEHLCTCCDPRSPLVLRPDFGLLAGAAEYALCVLHVPEPAVYRRNEAGNYDWKPELKLSARGEIVDAAGRVIARVASSDFQRLTTVDDEDGPRPSSGGGSPYSGGSGGGGGGAWAPQTAHVDLSQDDFYH